MALDRETTTTVKTLGYLHIGPPEDGIYRYSKLIATEARYRGLSVVEAEVALTADKQHNRAILMDAAQQLSAAEVIHLQHNDRLWGRQGRWQLYHLWTFLRHCRCPLIVTLHDVYPKHYPFSWGDIVNYFLQLYGPKALALRWLLQRADQTLVCTQEEARRLETFLANVPLNINLAQNNQISVLPHFVENRRGTVTRPEARRQLGLEGTKTITLLGWIFRRKGHRLMVESLAELPPDVIVVFAGQLARNSQRFAEEVFNLAESLGVKDRLRVTGYLSEEDLEKYVMATDLAVCPFRHCSASGSLSTWISIAHPKILASDLPQIQEYNQLEPGAIQTFHPYTPTTLATAIQQLLAEPDKNYHPAVVRLQQKLAMPAVFDKHLSHYQRAFQAVLPTQSSLGGLLR